MPRAEAPAGQRKYASFSVFKKQCFFYLVTTSTILIDDNPL